MRMLQRGARRSEAFTLVEVVVAIALFALSAAGIFALGLSVLRMNRLTHSVAEASMLAERKIEESLTTTPASVVSGSDSTGLYARVWTVSTNVGLPSRTLRVKVLWPGRAVSNEVSLVTILAP